MTQPAATPVPPGAPDSDIPSSAAYRVTLPEFEGPLDLLLYLCKTHEIEILDIPISFVTEKYLEYLELMRSLSVEVAAEYLVMAATLAYLKSRELVPVPGPLEATVDEDEDDPIDSREKLIRVLLEYRKYKDAALALGARPIEGRNVFGRGMPMEAAASSSPLAEHSAWKLIEYFSKLLAAARPRATHDVVIDRMSITDRINQLIDRLEVAGGSFRFDAIIDFAAPEAELRHQLVVTLLAILELARLKTVRVLQDLESETFFITRVEGASLTEARRAKVTSDETQPDEQEPNGQAQSETTSRAGAGDGIDGGGGGRGDIERTGDEPAGRAGDDGGNDFGGEPDHARIAFADEPVAADSGGSGIDERRADSAERVGDTGRDVPLNGRDVGPS